jgi:hypothetical protein
MYQPLASVLVTVVVGKERMAEAKVKKKKGL